MQQCRFDSGSIPDTAIGGIAELPSQPVNSGRHFFHWPPNLWVRPLTPNYPDELTECDFLQESNKGVIPNEQNKHT